jgi:oligosaccharide reducing-end xylanase
VVDSSALGRSSIGQVARIACCFIALSACGATVDPLGTAPNGASDPPPMFDSDTLKPLAGPATYPNAFTDLLGIPEAEITTRLDAEFERLFHGDPAGEAIYFTVGEDQAYIQDIFHGDTRSEGIALGMLIALQLGRRDEADRLWRFAASSLRHDSGPQRGYFRSTCSDGPCADPYGQQMLALALLLAHGRWSSRDGDIDYGAEALAVLNVMRQKELENGGVIDDVTNMFDAPTGLVVDEPNVARASRTRPSNVMPAAYELWAQATADASWQDSAGRGRQLLEAAAHSVTGLLPLRAQLDGTAVAGSDVFEPEGYRALLNMALDHVWLHPSDWYSTESDRLLGFFASQGLELYGSSYPLDGSSCLMCNHSTALVAMNGVSALASTRPDRADFVEAVWNSEPVDGQFRYYDGLLRLLSLLVLSGQFRVY